MWQDINFSVSTGCTKSKGNTTNVSVGMSSIPLDLVVSYTKQLPETPSLQNHLMLMQPISKSDFFVPDLDNITIMFVLRALHSFAARLGDMKPDKNYLQPKLARAANDSWRASCHH